MAERKRGRTAKDVVKDTGVSMAKGIVGLGESVMGLSDMMSHGLASRGWRAMGYNPEATRQYLDTLYSAPQQADNRAVEDARGIYGTTAAMMGHPMTMVHTGIEQVPQVLMAGNIGRQVAPHLAKAIPAPAASAIAKGLGEGVLGMGKSAELIARNNPDAVASDWGAAQNLEAAAHGAVDAAIDRTGNRIVRRASMGRLPDSSAVGAGLSEAGPENYMQQAKDAMVRRMGGGTVPAPEVGRRKEKRPAIDAAMIGL